MQVLMDPVCMLTCYPQLLANFVYKLPTLQDATSSIMGLTNSIRWLLARDLIIAEVCLHSQPFIPPIKLCSATACIIPWLFPQILMSAATAKRSCLLS